MTESPQVLALRQRYQQSLTEKSSVVSEFLSQISDAAQQANWQLSDELVNSIGEYLHKLAGSAGMYGYADVAQLARTALAANRQSDSATLHAHLDELRSLLEQHA